MRKQKVEIYLNFISKFAVPEAPVSPEVLAAQEEERRKKLELQEKRHQEYLRRKASGKQQEYDREYLRRRIPV